MLCVDIRSWKSEWGRCWSRQSTCVCLPHLPADLDWIRNSHPHPSPHPKAPSQSLTIFLTMLYQLVSKRSIAKRGAVFEAWNCKTTWLRISGEFEGVPPEVFVNPEIFGWFFKLVQIACSIVTAVASSAGLERYFSTLGLTYGTLRSSLGVEKAGKMAFLFKQLNKD